MTSLSQSAGSSPLAVSYSDQDAAAQPLSWYAVYTRAHHEKRIDLSLRQAAIEVFLPLIEQVHRWSDRRKVVQLPLFPGYVFVHIASTPGARLTVLKVPGVVAFVGRNGEGSEIPDGEIQQVRTVINQTTPFFCSPFLKVGQRVRVRGGALDGLEGILSSHGGSRMLVVSVELIQRSLSVSLEGYDVEPI